MGAVATRIIRVNGEFNDFIIPQDETVLIHSVTINNASNVNKSVFVQDGDLNPLITAGILAQTTYQFNVKWLCTNGIFLPTVGGVGDNLVDVIVAASAIGE